MNARIKNRVYQQAADADGWFMIEPKGEHPNKPAGVVQVIDDKAAQAIVDRFNRDAVAGTLPAGGKEMLVDHEHFRHDAEKETIAYGWLAFLDNRPDGIYGKISWTGTGFKAVDGGDYRFFSTEYAPEDLQILNPGEKPLRVRPLRLDGLTLTNDPNNKGGRPITNRNPATETDAHGNLINKPLDPLNSGGGGVPTEALSKWFAALGAIKKSLCKQAGFQMPYGQLYDLCRQQHPDLWQAAFGKADYGSFTPPAGAADEQQAAEDVTAIANRVMENSGQGQLFAYRFIREKFPSIFNRAFGGVAATGGKTSVLSPVSPQENALKTFNGLVEDEIRQHGFSRSQAHLTICNRHPALAEVANGTMTQQQAGSSDAQVKHMLNRTKPEITESEAQSRAMALFNKLADTEAQSSHVNKPTAIMRIQNRYPGLAWLANGRTTLKGFRLIEPELADQL